MRACCDADLKLGLVCALLVGPVDVAREEVGAPTLDVTFDLSNAPPVLEEMLPVCAVGVWLNVIDGGH